MSIRVLLLTCVVATLWCPGETRGQTASPAVRLAVLDFGDGPLGRLAAEKLASSLKLESAAAVVDRDLSRSAAKGVGYSGSLNLSLADARDLGAALGSDFLIIGDSQTLRRSPSTVPFYFESYASVFVVSARTGKLVQWQRPSIKAERPEIAERSLLTQLESEETRKQIWQAIRKAHDDEREARAMVIDSQTPFIEAAPDDEKEAQAAGLRLPRPFRRLIPAYTASAAEAEAEATVDVVVDISDKGDVMRVDVARWAGFGLDESTVTTVQRLNFFPAMRDGVPVPMRVLLRYNFRKPPK
ncbi:MAG TPA: TonB family protein [Pyrinomonadaceae bacterium]|nr:TonB family protein [Pyrinomonadaceae bacterium]